MKAHRALGPGFLESVYRNALAFDLRRAGLTIALAAAEAKPIDLHSSALIPLILSKIPSPVSKSPHPV